MQRKETIRHEFVEYIPEHLVDGVLYISVAYNTVAHSCLCGCREQVITPLSPTDWKLIYDGKAVSLHPSIGSWNLPCRSHYWIRAGAVQWAESWSREQVAAEREFDRTAKADYYGDRRGVTETSIPACREEQAGIARRPAILTRLARLLGLS